MTLRLYTALRALPLVRHARKDDPAPARPTIQVQEARADRTDPVVYAAGIACAGQVTERLER
jgi:hypothetical protein